MENRTRVNNVMTGIRPTATAVIMIVRSRCSTILSTRAAKSYVYHQARVWMWEKAVRRVIRELIPVSQSIIIKRGSFANVTPVRLVSAGVQLVLRPADVTSRQ